MTGKNFVFSSGNVDAIPTKPEDRRYMAWENAGGPNECEHGYAESIPCPRCDAKQSLTEMVGPSRPVIDPDQTSHLPSKDTPGCGCAVATVLFVIAWSLAYLTCGS